MNQNNISLETVIAALEACSLIDKSDCSKCYLDGPGFGFACRDQLMRNALALLKAQEPRVLTLGDLRDIGSVWELNTPPYLWMETNPSYRWTRGFWVAWREIFNMIDGLHPTYDADNYGKIWRCRTSKPSLKQMEETPWPTN